MVTADTLKENVQDVSLAFCKPEQFDSTVKDSFNFLGINNTLCLTNQPLLGGYFNIDYYKYIQIELMMCKNTTENNNFCYPEDVITQFVKKNDKVLALYYQNFIFKLTDDLDHYDYYIKTFYHNLGFASCRRIDIETMNQNITTDNNGFFLSTLVYHGEQTIDSIETDYYVKQSPSDECLTKVNLFVSESNYLIKRTYMKVQDLIAQVGGLLGIVKMACSTILGFAYKRRMNEHLIHGLFEIRKEEVQNVLQRENANIVEKSVKEKESQLPSKDNVTHPNYTVISNSQLPSVRKSPIELQGPSKERNLKNYYGQVSMIKLNEDMNNEKFQKDESRVEKHSFTKNKLFGENNNKEIKNLDKGTKIGKKELLEKLKLIVENPCEIKKNPKDIFIFTLCDNFLLNIFKCCMSRRMKKLDEYFKKLWTYSISNTDVLTIAHKFSEIDKLKFILLDQKQLAIFNMKAKLCDPLREKNKIKLLSCSSMEKTDLLKRIS